MESGSFESPWIEYMLPLLGITFYAKLRCPRRGTCRKQHARMLKSALLVEWHPKWLLEVKTWARGSPLCMFSTAKDGLSKVEVLESYDKTSMHKSILTTNRAN
jgi:hypothetical protein